MSESVKKREEMRRRFRTALSAAQEGARVIERAYGRGWNISEKGVGDLVSEVDIEAERAIVRVIRSEDPTSNIISEEGMYKQDPSCISRWIIDPLDGTSAFLMQAGKDKPSVLIAHQLEGVTTLAIVYFPLTDQFFYAVRNEGSYDRQKERLEAPQDVSLRETWVEINQFGDASLESAVFARLRTRLRSKDGARLVTSQVPHSGIAMRMLDGSSGLRAVIHDNHPDKVKQAPWDVAAPQLIVEEAGGVVLKMDGKPYNIWKPEPFVMATSRKLALEIIALASK